MKGYHALLAATLAMSCSCEATSNINGQTYLVRDTDKDGNPDLILRLGTDGKQVPGYSISIGKEGRVSQLEDWSFLRTYGDQYDGCHTARTDIPAGRKCKLEGEALQDAQDIADKIRK